MDLDNAIKQSLVDLCRIIYQKNMVCGSGGNISARVDDKIFITPSGYSLGAINPEDIVAVSFDGTIEGSVKPSSELLLHMGAYEVRPDIRAVVHVHSLYSILVGINADENLKVPMPPYTPSYAISAAKIAQIPFYVPGTLELAHEVKEKLRESNVVIMKNHGMVVVGKDLQEAFNVAEEVEQNAKMHIMIGGKGSLSNEQVQAVIEQYK